MAKTGTGLRIGISSAIMAGDPERKIFGGKTLLYTTTEASSWFMGRGCKIYLIPTFEADPSLIGEYADDLDGLILQGGADVSPGNYGEIPMKPEWAGDSTRDFYEFALIEACMERRIPIIGLCRGAQVINVYFGGSLFQDISTQNPGALVHRNPEIYDRNGHQVNLAAGGLLSELYQGRTNIKVNSVHHQAVKELAPGFAVEAKSSADGIIEAIRWDNPQDPRFILGLQWHPEWTRSDLDFDDPSPILDKFIQACQDHKRRR